MVERAIIEDEDENDYEHEHEHEKCRDTLFLLISKGSFAMASPTELRYTKDHEWVRAVGGEALVGITDHAQSELGDITFIELPKLGRRVGAGEKLADVESVKAASEIFAPVSGEVVAVNEALSGAPEQMNSSPYDQGWIARLKMSDPGEMEKLMNAAQYDALVEKGPS